MNNIFHASLIFHNWIHHKMMMVPIGLYFRNAYDFNANMNEEDLLRYLSKNRKNMHLSYHIIQNKKCLNKTPKRKFTNAII